MEINEKYGIVKKTTHKWDNLVDMIINYLYDINGLQNDIDMLNDQHEITLSMLKIFYKDAIHSFSFPDNIIPEWIGDFSLFIVDANNYANGYINTKNISFENDKLNCCIYFTFNLSNYYPVSKMTSMLTHEFRHLYTKWLEHKYDFKLVNERYAYIYSRFMQINKQVAISDKKDSMLYMLAKLLYLVTPDEINAYMQSFDKESKKVISDNIDIIRSFMQKHDKKQPNISPLNTSVYNIYMDALQFINTTIRDLDAMKVERDELVDVAYNNDLRDMINAYMINDNKDSNRILDLNIYFIYMEDDTKDDIYIRSYYVLADFLIKFLKRIRPQIEKIIKKMDKLFIQNAASLCTID